LEKKKKKKQRKKHRKDKDNKSNRVRTMNLSNPNDSFLILFLPNKKGMGALITSNKHRGSTGTYTWPQLMGYMKACSSSATSVNKDKRWECINIFCSSNKHVNNVMIVEGVKHSNTRRKGKSTSNIGLFRGGRVNVKILSAMPYCTSAFPGGGNGTSLIKLQMYRSIGMSPMLIVIWYNEVKYSWHWTKKGNLVIKHKHLEANNVL